MTDCCEELKWVPWKIDLFGSKTTELNKYSKQETYLTWSLVNILFIIGILYTIYFSNYKNHTELVYKKGISFNEYRDFCKLDMHYTGCRCLHNSSNIFDCDLQESQKCSSYICHGWIKLEVYHVIFNYFSNIGGVLSFIVSLHMGLFLLIKNNYINKIHSIINELDEVRNTNNNEQNRIETIESVNKQDNTIKIYEID